MNAQLDPAVLSAGRATPATSRASAATYALVKLPASQVPAPSIGIRIYSAHRVLQDMAHVALITSESGAAASSKAILDVVAAVRTGAAVAKQ